MSRKITITLSDQQVEQLQAQAKKDGTNPSTLAADLIKFQLRLNDPNQEALAKNGCKCDNSGD
jgi:hypothetical protein